MAKKILITGGAGFIGSHLTQLLLAQGQSVHIIDDLSTGKRENIAAFLGDQCTLEVQTVADAFAKGDDWISQYDQVYHLAAAVGVKLIVQQPVHTIEANVVESAALLDAVAKFNIPTLIASSSEVYGKSTRVPFREDDDVIYGSTRFSRWSYAMTKAIDEYLALAHHRQTGLKVVIARFFNTVGPGQISEYGMVVPSFIERAVTNSPIEVYGDGLQTRCFCHVADVAGSLPKLLNNNSCFGKVFNVGSNEEVTINELAKRIVALSGSQSELVYVPYDEAYDTEFDDLRRRVPDLGRVKQAIGFELTHDLDKILVELIDQARQEQ